MSPLEPSRLTRLLTVVMIVGGIGVFGLGAGKLMCRSSLRTCGSPSDICPEDTYCIDYGDGWSRCSPDYCFWVKDCCAMPPEFRSTMHMMFYNIQESMKQVISAFRQ